MKVDKIYFDMDGVLADFSLGVVEMLKMMPRNQKYQEESYNNKLFDAIRDYPDFYYHLKPIEGSIEILNELRKKYDVEILTGIPKPEKGIIEAADNKKAWIRKYFDDELVVNAVQRRDKQKFCKGESYILIDDYDINIKQWIKKGGTGILFVTPKQFKSELESFGLL